MYAVGWLNAEGIGGAGGGGGTSPQAAAPTHPKTRKLKEKNCNHSF